MIDFHCHLDLYPDALTLVDEVSRRNEFTLVVTTSPRAWVASSRVFAGRSRIHMALGLHPEIVLKKRDERELLISSIDEVRFVGEIGIDGSPQHADSLPEQMDVFAATLQQCERAGGKILSIHSRNAAGRVLDSIERHCGRSTPVLHWFSGTQSELKHAIDLGCWFSVGPAMLAGDKGRRLASLMPPDRVLPETDGPFAQRQLRPLMPWQAIEVAEQFAESWARSRTAVMKQMRLNLASLVGDAQTATD